MKIWDHRCLPVTCTLCYQINLHKTSVWSFINFGLFWLSHWGQYEICHQVDNERSSQPPVNHWCQIDLPKPAFPRASQEPSVAHHHIQLFRCAVSRCWSLLNKGEWTEISCHLNCNHKGKPCNSSFTDEETEAYRESDQFNQQAELIFSEHPCEVT